MAQPEVPVVDEARAALRAGDAARALRVLAAADEAAGPVLDCQARAMYLQLDFHAAVETWERAYAAYRAADDQLGAVRVARTLGFMHGAVMGDGAVMQGWLARAQTLLVGTVDSSERGWVALNLGIFDGSRDRKEERFREALAVGRSLGDVELELVALAYLGATLVHADRAEEGMVLLDEALAAVAGSEVDDFLVLQEIFCQLFSACEHACDVGRADQWIRIGEAIAARRRLPAVSAFCHTHYGGVLTAAGRWPEADATLTEAVRLWGLGYRSLRAGALIRLADLRVRQGRLEEAEQLLIGLGDYPEAGVPLAAIQLARARPGAALEVLERALTGAEDESSASAPLLSLLVDAHLAAEDIGAAQEAADRLEQCAAAHPTDYVGALAALARARVCLAAGTGDPTASLRRALAGFGRANLPMELARAHLAFAHALAGDRPELAAVEARVALDAFGRLQAARDADAAAAVLRSLGSRAANRGTRGDGPLSKRENEVLALLGHGLSNPEIAERLYLSRKTVEHHVGNILTKLGLRSRAEAAAYAVRAKPAEE